VLEVAMSFEQTAHRFYSALVDRVSKPLRDLVEDLAEEEARHYKLFEDLAQREDVRAHIQDRITTPPSDHKFSNYVHLPDLGDDPDDQAILQYAMGREHAAMEQYGTLAAEAPAGPIRDLFAFLAAEETEHKRDLEKRYYALVHSGGV
jgi:rubrerythrin